MRFIVCTFCVMLLVSSCTNPTKPISPRVNHVMLYVSNLDSSITFYTQAFDLKVTNKLDTLFASQPDGTELARPVRMAFLKFPVQDFVFELAERLDSGTQPTAFLYQHVGIDVMDIEAAHKRALDAGAKELAPIKKVRAKGLEAMQAFVAGPDGERLELMQIISGEF